MVDAVITKDVAADDAPLGPSAASHRGSTDLAAVWKQSNVALIDGSCPISVAATDTLDAITDGEHDRTVVWVAIERIVDGYVATNAANDINDAEHDGSPTYLTSASVTTKCIGST